MAKAAKKKIKFEPLFATEAFADPAMGREYDKFGNPIEIPMLAEVPFKMVKGEEKEISQEDFEVLVARGSVRTKKEQAERMKLYKRRRQALAPLEPRAELSDEEKNLLFNDLPHEI